MKQNIYLTAILFLSAITATAQNDTMYVMKNGVVINKQSIKSTDVDSIIFYRPQIKSSGTVTDADDNVYKTTTIGSQTWMAENLKTTKYNDGLPIPWVTDTIEWSKLSTPAYCWYYNDKVNFGNIYGALYNWYTVNTGKLCPVGWHVPSDDDWTELSTYLGSYIIAGGKLKETGTLHWNSPNIDATNETNFTALPGGYRYGNGIFYDMGLNGSWWSATENSDKSWVVYRIMYSVDGYLTRNSNEKPNGYSVRCLKDN